MKKYIKLEKKIHTKYPHICNPDAGVMLMNTVSEHVLEQVCIKKIKNSFWLVNQKEKKKKKKKKKRLDCII